MSHYKDISKCVRANLSRVCLAVSEPLEDRLLLSGTNYLVDSLSDVVAVDGAITLREAVEAANTNVIVGDAAAGSGTDTDIIEFAPELFTTGNAVLLLGGTEIEITGDLSIIGPSSGELTIDADNISRVFNVTANVTLELYSLTMANGRAELSSGGAIAGLIGNAAQGDYGSTVVLTDSVIRDSFADYSGGGIYSGTLSINNSTIQSNVSGNFAGIYGVDVEILNSFITLNRAADSSGGVFGSELGLINSVVAGNYAGRYGGGVYCNDLTAINSTVAGNYAGLSGGGVYCRNGFADIINSIVTMNDGGDISGTYTQNYSIVGVDPHFVSNPADGGDGWGDDPATSTTDESANDFLGDLRLLSTSAAIDFASTADAVDFDGLALTADIDANPRNVGTSVDSGAYEFQSTPASGMQSPSAEIDSELDAFDLYDGLVTVREAIWYVSTNQLGGVNTISFASVLSGQEVILNGTELLIDTDLAIDASSLSGGITINASGLSRVFMVDTGKSLSAYNIEITGGSAIDGGGVYLCSGAAVSLYGSELGSNVASQYGGAIYGQAASQVEIINSNLTDNHSLWSGGAVHVESNSVINISGANFTANAAGEFGYGGAVSASQSVITVTDSEFKSNLSGMGGGAIVLWNSELSATGLTLKANRSSSGGALYAWDSDLHLSNSVVAGNTAVSGGGVTAEYNSVVDLVNSNIVSNAADTGGGLWSDSSTLALANTITALNVAADSSDIYGTYTANFSLIGIDPLFLAAPDDGGDGWGDDPATAVVDESQNDNYGDLRLSPGSPAIDAGSSALAVDFLGDPLAEDIRSANRITGSSVDIGAYEFLHIPGDADGNEAVNIFDFLTLKSNYGLQTGATWAQGDFDGNGKVDIFDFLILKGNYGT